MKMVPYYSSKMAKVELVVLIGYFVYIILHNYALYFFAPDNVTEIVHMHHMNYHFEFHHHSQHPLGETFCLKLCFFTSYSWHYKAKLPILN